MKKLHKTITKKFNALPGYVKAGFYMMLNSLVILIMQDIQKYQTINEYMNIIVPFIVNVLAYIALNLKTKAQSVD